MHLNPRILSVASSNPFDKATRKLLSNPKPILCKQRDNRIRPEARAVLPEK